MKLCLALALMTMLTVAVWAQAPAIQWSHTYGGAYRDVGWCVQQTSGGGYAMLGTTASYGSGNNDFWFVKTDASGNQVWARTYGGSGPEEGWRFQQTTDGGYILAGATASYGAGNYDFWLVKTDANGILTWSRTFGGTNDDRAECVIQTSDGGYAIGGYTMSYGAGNRDFWVVKTDANGNAEWTHTYGSTSLDELNYMIQTSDGGYALGGYSLSFGNGYQTYVVKTDALGNAQWSHPYGGSSDETCWGIEQTMDGGYILGGMTMTNSYGAKDMWMDKIDANGTQQWIRHFGGYSNDWCNSIHQTWDGGYILGGWTQSYGSGGLDLYVVKTDANGNALWSSVYGGAGWDQVTTIQHTADDGYVALGWTTSWGHGQEDFWMVKYAPDHTLPVELLSFEAVNVGRAVDVRFSTASESNNASFEIWRAEAADGEYTRIAQIASHGNSSTRQDYHYTDEAVQEGHRYWYYLVNNNTDGSRTEHRDRTASVTVQGAAVVTEYSLSAYPNPFNPTTALSFTLPEAAHVTLKVYDCSGRLVSELADASFQSGEHRITFNGANLPTGVYLARLETPSKTLTHKLLLVK